LNWTATDVQVERKKDAQRCRCRT